MFLRNKSCDRLLPIPEISRNQVIDAFRGIAIISIMIFHYTVMYPDIYGYSYTFPPEIETARRGVELFFVISGLVIAMTVLKTHSAADFAVKRFARIFPPLFFCCSLTWLVENLYDGVYFHASVPDYFFSLVLLAKKLKFHYVDAVYWTLGVEVIFYVFVAIGYALLKERFWMLLIPISLIWHKYYAFFLAGMWMYYYFFDRKNPAVRWLLPISLCLYVWFAFGKGSYKAYEDIYAFAMPFALFLTLKFAMNARLGPLAWIGRISYPLYLLHENIGVIIIVRLKKTGLNDLASLGAAAAICIMLAAAIHYVIEMPAQKRVLRLWTRRKAEQPSII